MVVNGCKISTSRYIRIIAGILFWRWLWIACVPFVAAVCLAFSDVRFLIIALLIAFVVMPLALLFIYIYFGLTPEARFSVLEKTINVNPSRLVADFSPLGDGYPTPKPVKLDLSRVSSVDYRKDCFVLTIDRHLYRPVAIPFSCFDSPDDVREFSSILSNHIK